MRPRAVIALRFLKKADDAGETLEALRLGDEVALHANHNSHDAEAAGSGGHDARIARDAFQSHARSRMRTAFPVVAETLFLQHAEQLIVRHRIGLCTHGPRERGGAVLFVDYRDLVGHMHVQTANEVGVAMEARVLNTDSLERAVVDGSENDGVGKLVGVSRFPLEVDMALKGFGAQIVGHR